MRSPRRACSPGSRAMVATRPGRSWRSRRRRFWRRCRSPPASVTSTPSRVTSRPAGASAAARSRGLVPGADLLLLESGVGSWPRRARAPAGGDANARLRARDRGRHRRRRGDRGVHAAERLERPGRPARGDDGRARPRQGQGLRAVTGAVAGHPRRAALRGRPPPGRGHGNGQRPRAHPHERRRAAFLVARAGGARRPRHALRAGDVLGSGTLNRGCLLELGPLDGDRFLEPGDEVAISADGLGTLSTTIA